MICLHHVRYKKILQIVSDGKGVTTLRRGFSWKGECLYCKREFFLNDTEKRVIFKAIEKAA